MKVFSTRNAHQVLPWAIDLLLREGQSSISRAGEVLAYPTPVTTVYLKPNERCIFYPERNWNPFFFMMESLWILNGRRDTEWLVQFNKRMMEYSDDGEKFHGAYGYRWRYHFGIDQLNLIVSLLKNCPDTRRAVLQMWDCVSDLHEEEETYKDIPCNDLVTFRINEGYLDITVMNRSNDIIWGAYGANCMQFSMLQDYISARVGVPSGKYYQISNNFHAYKNVLSEYSGLSIHAPDPFRTVSRCPYERGEVIAYTDIFSVPEEWDHDLSMFMNGSMDYDFKNKFFHEIAVPMYQAHKHWRNKDNKYRFADAFSALGPMPHCDWKLTSHTWLKKQYEIFRNNTN